MSLPGECIEVQSNYRFQNSEFFQKIIFKAFGPSSLQPQVARPGLLMDLLSLQPHSRTPNPKPQTTPNINPHPTTKPQTPPNLPPPTKPNHTHNPTPPKPHPNPGSLAGRLRTPLLAHQRRRQGAPPRRRGEALLRLCLPS